MRDPLVRTLAAALFALAGASAFAAPAPVHFRLVEAEKVALGYDVGGRFVSEAEGAASQEVLTADRRALAAVRDGLHEWGRHTLVDRPGQADVLFVIRVGRLASGTFTTTIGGRRSASELSGRTIAAEVSSPHDTLTVYAAAGKEMGEMLWEARLRGGLAEPSVPLFRRLRAAVEGAPRRP